MTGGGDLCGAAHEGNILPRLVQAHVGEHLGGVDDRTGRPHAGAVLARDVADGMVVAGNPAVPFRGGKANP